MSRRPFSLSAYLALTRPAEAPGPVLERPARPDGPLLWLHAASAADQPPLAALAARITQQSPELSLLKTGYWPDGDAVDLPEETLAQAQDFLAHWRPNLLVWAGQDLRPALMEAMRLAGRASLLVNAREAPFSTPAPRWLPDAAPAALSRKMAWAKFTGEHTIDIWGDGEQSRSFMYIDDCVRGSQEILAGDNVEPVNLGSAELVTINQMVDILEDIAGIKLERTYQLDAPQGVRGRNSDNTMFREIYGWEPSITLRDGLEKTYGWIYDILAQRV